MLEYALLAKTHIDNLLDDVLDIELLERTRGG